MIENTESTAPYEWSIAKIATALGMCRKTVSRRITENDIRPSNKVKGSNVYALKDVAPALFQTNLTSITDGQHDPSMMPPKDRKDWFQSENERLKFEEAEGQLCATHDVARQMSIMAKAMIQVLDTLPDILERDCGLQPREVSKVQSTIDDLRDQLAARLMDNCD